MRAMILMMLVAMMSMALAGCREDNSLAIVPVGPEPIIKDLQIMIDEPSVSEEGVVHGLINTSPGGRFLVRAHYFTVYQISEGFPPKDVRRAVYDMSLRLYDEDGHLVSQDHCVLPFIRWVGAGIEPTMFLLKAEESGEHRLEITVECREPSGAKSRWTRSITVRIKA